MPLRICRYPVNNVEYTLIRYRYQIKSYNVSLFVFISINTDVSYFIPLLMKLMTA